MEEKVIGERIDAIRKERGWSKSELGKRMNLRNMVTLYKHIETGKMTTDWLVRYCNALGCTISDLTDDVVDLTKFTLSTDIYSYWPYNIAKAVAGLLEMDVYKIYVPGLYETLCTLEEREQKILDMRYRNGMTLEECARVLGVSRERVRQVEAKALRKLRHPSRYKHWFLEPLEKYYAEAEEKSRLLRENITLRDKLRRTGVTEEEVQEEIEEDNPLNVPIDEMELSVRSYNCLNRAGIREVKDLEDMSIEKLMMVRNLGRKSMEEVVEKAKKWGIKIK